MPSEQYCLVSLLQVHMVQDGFNIQQILRYIIILYLSFAFPSPGRVKPQGDKTVIAEIVRQGSQMGIVLGIQISRTEDGEFVGIIFRVMDNGRQETLCGFDFDFFRIHMVHRKTATGLFL